MAQCAKTDTAYISECQQIIKIFSGIHGAWFVISHVRKLCRNEQAGARWIRKSGLDSVPFVACATYSENG